MWKKLTLTTAANTQDISFAGRGSIYAEGTFGGGSVQLHIKYIETTGAYTVSTAFVDSAIDGTTIKSIDCPAGHYQLNLAGSTGASVTVLINDQTDLTIDK